MSARMLMDYVLIEGPEVVVAPAGAVTRYLGHGPVQVDTYGLPSCGFYDYESYVITAVQAYTDSDIATMLHALSGEQKFDRVMQVWCNDLRDYELIPESAYEFRPVATKPEPKFVEVQLERPEKPMQFLKGKGE